MRRTALTLAVFFLFGWAGLAASTALDVEFLPDEHLIAGTQVVSWQTPPGVAWFTLPANLGREPNPHVSGRVEDQQYPWGFDPSWTEIDGLWWVDEDGQERELDYELLATPPNRQTYSLDDGVLKVELPEEEGQLRIEFRTRFPHIRGGEPGRVGDVYTWRFGWHPLPSPPVEDGYLPQLILPHAYRVRLALPDGWAATLPGQAERKEEPGEVVYRSSFTEPVRSVSLFIAPVQELTEVALEGRELTLELVAQPGHEDEVRALATYIWEIMEYFEERYGPYPFDRLLLVEHPSDEGIAFAADGVVFMPSWLFRRSDLTARGTLSRLGQFVLSHEIAHQWWGVGVGADLDEENWLSEGFAHYAAMRWFEERYGAEGGNLFRPQRPGLGEALLETALGYFNLREHMVELPYLDTTFMGFDEAIVKPTSEVEYLQVSGVRLYEKGALVMRALAHLVGGDVLDDALRQTHERYRREWLSVESFQELVEEVSEQDLSSFFADWVWGDAQADYAVEGMNRRRTEDGHETHVHLERSGSGFLPVTVEVQGADDQRNRRTWEATDDDQTTMVFETDYRVRRVVVDPEHRVPDVDRLNNNQPRRFVVAMDKNRVPLDAYVVQPDPATQAVSLRHLDRFGVEVVPELQAASGWVNYGREFGVSGWAQVTDTLIGQLSLTRRLWSTPEIGSPGTYWMPAGELSLTMARTSTPLWVAELGVSWQEQVSRVSLGAASVLFVPEASAGRVTLAGMWEERLLPRTYIRLAVRGGLATEGMPNEFLLGLEEFNTLGSPDTLDVPDSIPPSPKGQYKASGTLSLWLPESNPDYLLGGLALLSDVRIRAYFTAGRVWSQLEDWATIPTYTEAGGEVWTTWEALGGLLQLRVVLGLAWPISPAGTGVFYLGIDM
ncbi:MAG: M1 family aminopeptidase [Candidatus Bipolaricaulota bacterium]